MRTLHRSLKMNKKMESLCSKIGILIEIITFIFLIEDKRSRVMHPGVAALILLDGDVTLE